MTIFSDALDFYPTPKWLATKMLKPYTRGDNATQGYSILEPSAGKGDILDVIVSDYRSSQFRLYCLERNPDLAFTLQGKGYTLLGHDFLTFDGNGHYFDLIVMNPPFSVGATHLLHAWNILRGGDLCCLLNAETVRNPHTKERKLLANLIEQFGTVEYISEGFADAERKTTVEVALVRLTKKSETDELKFEFEGVESATESAVGEEDAITGSALAGGGRQLEAMIRAYDMSREGFLNYCRAAEGVRQFSEILTHSQSPLELMNKAYGEANTTSGRMNAYGDLLREQAWLTILSKLGLSKYLTKGLQEKFEQFRKQSGKLALTQENVRMVLSQIIQNSGDIMQQAVVAVFDIFTKYHDDNRVHVEGWKTNDSWKVNRKIVLPYWIDNSWSTRPMIASGKWMEYADIDKVMCYLSGMEIDKIVTIKTALEKSFHENLWGPCSSEFFNMRYFKKGTLHLTFKTEELWNKFNLTAVAGKNWVGNASGK